MEFSTLSSPKLGSYPPCLNDASHFSHGVREGSFPGCLLHLKGRAQDSSPPVTDQESLGLAFSKGWVMDVVDCFNAFHTTQFSVVSFLCFFSPFLLQWRTGGLRFCWRWFHDINGILYKQDFN